MNRNLQMIFLCLLFMGGLAPSVVGQVISLPDLPPEVANNRFAGDLIFGIDRPSLTLNGFDCGASCGNGLGLRQILEAALPRTELEAQVAQAALAIFAPANWDEANQNAARLEAYAFVALASYVVESNGHPSQTLGLPDHAVAAQRLRGALVNPSNWQISKGLDDDLIRWTTHYMSMARALDLYYALENAYCYYGANGHSVSQSECTGATNSRLLSATEKIDVLDDFNAQTTLLASLVNYLGIADRTLVERGNVELKFKTSLAYGTLVRQTDLPYPIQQVALATAILEGGMESALRTSTSQEQNLNYQTKNGKKFFAEGPYYWHFALADVIPFWHAIRVNNMLARHPAFNAPDPFNTPSFTAPLEWLADVATPDGATPPLDDGNKWPMAMAALLSWDASFGTASTGQKFAWVQSRRATPAAPPLNLALLELSIPRLIPSQGISPGDIGNTSSAQTGESGDQQIVLRPDNCSTGGSGDCHFVLLNGESGRAYGGGEGHEQADQLQLL